MKALKTIWNYWLKFAFALGNFITTIFLIIFYFTIFAIFALPFKLKSNILGKKSNNSNWIDKKLTLSSLRDFENEY